MEDKKISLLYRLIRFGVKVFSPKYEIRGTEHLPEGACVIVGNHCHMYGPMEAELYTPGPHYIWCAGEMMNLKEVAAYSYRDFWSGSKPAARPFFKLLSHLIPPLAVCVFGNAHCIPVYHDMRVIETFRESQEWLEKGYRIVIFPEHYTPYNNIVYEFQDKFIDMARTYRKKTGKDLAFVPMYLAPSLKTVTYGEPVYYDMAVPGKEERRAVAVELMERITAMAAEQPKHIVIPYPNMSKKYYKESLPVEKVRNEKTES
ncbi:MAG: hypothetical protein K5891_06630 [Lachnospiraceae bacterium]|nr:hypothetical protein [Lachnospiraceae bacterium]